jgi:methyl-accepting chemotaxis protein
MSGTPIPHDSSSPSLFNLYNLAALSQDFEQDVNMSETSSDPDMASYNGPYGDRTASPMTISLDGTFDGINRTSGQARGGNGASSSAPPTSHLDYIPCPICSRPVSDIGKITTVFKPTATGSPQVLPPGPLTTAAFESGMSAVEELRLLKAQVQDVARVCNAVACGDLSQKITVPVQGVVMVQLKDVINGMVDKLGQFAREVTRVSQEVGTEGYVSPVLTSLTHLTLFSSVNSVVRLSCSTSKALGASSLASSTSWPLILRIKSGTSPVLRRPSLSVICPSRSMSTHVERY